MKNLAPTILCILLVFSLSCETEPLDNINQQLNIVQDGSDDTTEDEDESEDEESCETLFAIGGEDNSTCFLDDGFNRWGWTIGPLTGGDYTFDLYSGAGQCDTDKGTLVGSLSVNYDETLETIEIDFTMQEGYTLNETHLYVGNDPYPTGQNGQNTVAPGQYPYQNQLDGASSDSYSLEGISGEIYVIAHGVVCEDTDDDDDDNDDGNDDGGGAF